MSGYDCNKKNCENNSFDNKDKCRIDVKKGQVMAFCACGLSKNKPYCDGSHSELGVCKSNIIKFKKDETIYICDCNRTKNKPICDGSCKKIKKKEVKDEYYNKGKPLAIKVKKGINKAFCMCGLSKNKPYCDGSHVLTECSAKVVKPEKDETFYICGCGKTKDKPFCDNSCGKLNKKEE